MTRGRYFSGDRVRCLVDRFAEFTRGEIYVVATSTDDYVNVEADDEGLPNGSYAAHFESAENRPAGIVAGEILGDGR
jgi:hypothetical protein